VVESGGFGKGGEAGPRAGRRRAQARAVSERGRRPSSSAGAGGRRQWAQAFGLPSSSAVRKLEPQPQAATAFGLLTVNPAPMSVST